MDHGPTFLRIMSFGWKIDPSDPQHGRAYVTIERPQNSALTNKSDVRAIIGLRRHIIIIYMSHTIYDAPLLTRRLISCLGSVPESFHEVRHPPSCAGKIFLCHPSIIRPHDRSKAKIEPKRIVRTLPQKALSTKVVPFGFISILRFPSCQTTT